MSKYTIEIDEAGDTVWVAVNGLRITRDYVNQRLYPNTEGVDPAIIEMVRLANIGINSADEYQRGYDAGYEQGLPQ